MIAQYDFMRILAFLMVFVYHGCVLTKNNIAIVRYAGLAVAFFFVLSGFLSGLGHADRNAGFTWRGEFSYLLAKLKRFWPLVAITTLISALYYDRGVFFVCRTMCPQDQMEWFGQLLINLGLLNAWCPSWTMGFNGVTWFLSALFFLYVIRLPLLVCFQRLKNLRGGVLNLVVAGVIVLSVDAYLSYCITDVWRLDSGYWLYVCPLMHIPDYALGMIAGICVAKTIRRESWTPPVGRVIMWTVIEIFAIAWWLGVVARPLSGHAWAARTLQYLLPNLVLLFVLGRSNGLIVRMLNNRLSLELGKFAMPAFMIHQVVLYLFCRIDTLKISFQIPVENYFWLATCLVLTFFLSLSFIRDRNKLTKLIPISLAVLLLAIPLTVVASRHYLQGETVKVRFEKDLPDFADLKAVCVYYTTPRDPKISERQKTTAAFANRSLETFLPHDATGIRIDLYYRRNTAPASEALPKPVSVQYGRRALDGECLRAFDDQKYNYSGYRCEKLPLEE